MDVKTNPNTRRHDLDWVRVFAILVVFLYHSAHFFDQGDWSVKNATTYASATQWFTFLEIWAMPLVFVISGASIWYAIRKASPARFLTDRALRLLVPLAVGALTHASLQVYVERVSHGQFAGSYLQFLPHYFEGIYMPGGTGNFAFHGLHLWYLLLLFLYSLLFLPLFLWLRGGAGMHWLGKLGDFLALPAAVCLLALPTVLLRHLLGEEGFLGGFRLGGWNLPQYVWFLMAGFLIISHARLQQRIIQARWVALALGMVLVTAPLLSGRSVARWYDLACWCWIAAIIGTAMKHFTFRNSLLDYANEAVLPFYILHQSVMLVLGFFIVRWIIPDLAKYSVIVAASFMVSLVFYELLVRHNNVMRVLFGMHPRRRSAPISRHAPTPRALGQGEGDMA